MTLCFLYDARVWENAEARYALETLAPLLDLPWRSTAARDAIGEGEALVFVGPSDRAPAEAAAIVALGEWGAWDAARLEVATFEGEPLLCPGGAFDPPADPRELPAAWLRAAWHLLSREEERASTRRDQWECWSGLYSRAHELGVLERPLLDACAGQLSRRIAAWAARRGVMLATVPRWKNGAPFAAALTHDVDDISFYSWRGAARLLAQARDPGSYALRGGLAALARAFVHAGRSDDPYWSFDRWMGEESRRGFRSSFYFCPPAPARRHEYDALYAFGDPVGFEGRRIKVAEMMLEMVARGFEVGLHGSYMSHRDGEELARQKSQIEDAAGIAAAGIRQHFLRFEVRETWEAQARAGFGYDTTLGYNEAIGFRAGIAAPFHPWDPARRAAMALLELPLTVMDGALFRTMKLDAAAAARRTREHLDRVEAVRGLAVLLWHPNAADEAHFPGWWPCYLAALDRLVERGAWVATAAEIAAWWREREGRLARG